MNATQITWFQFYPNQEAANLKALYVGLRSQYDPDLVDFLKRKGRTYRRQYSANAVFWSAECKSWAVAPTYWTGLCLDLKDKGYRVVNGPRPKDADVYQPVTEQPPLSLEDALTWLSLRGMPLFIHADGKLLVKVPNGAVVPEPVLTAIRLNRSLLMWLLSAQPETSKTSSQRVRHAAADPYAVLGVERSATRAVIEQQYKQLIRSVHPDRVPDDMDPEIREVAETKSKLINAAWTTLKERVRA